jgi:hypothetical protein
LQVILDAETSRFCRTRRPWEAVGRLASDAEGHMTVSGLIPGAMYTWSDGKKTHEFTAEAGKTHELPDLVIQRPGR